MAEHMAPVVDDPTWPCAGDDCLCRDAVELPDPDRLPPTVVPAVVDELGGWPVITPALRPGLL